MRTIIIGSTHIANLYIMVQQVSPPEAIRTARGFKTKAGIIVVKVKIAADIDVLNSEKDETIETMASNKHIDDVAKELKLVAKIRGLDDICKAVKNLIK